MATLIFLYLFIGTAKAEAPLNVIEDPEPPEEVGQVVETIESDIKSLVASYDWPLDKAHSIIKCESGWNTEAVGDKNTEYWSYGLFQVRALPGRLPPEELLKPEVNIREAYSLWSETRSFRKHWVNCSAQIPSNAVDDGDEEKGDENN